MANSIKGSISSTKTLSATIASGGVTDHNKLKNRDADDQHPISAITDLQDILDEKLDSSTALPLIEDAVANKAKGLYYDSDKLLGKTAYWYLTSEIDSDTGLGIIGNVNRTKKYGYEYVISGPYNLGAGGGGGSGTGVTTVKLTTTNPETGESMWHSNVAYGQTCKVGIYWTSTKDDEPTGSGTIYVSVNGTTVITKVNAQGIVYFDLTDYLTLGANKVTFRVVDAYSTSKTLIGSINAVSINLTSTFDNSKNFSGKITFDYKPYGSLTKIVHFILDDTEIGTQTVTTSGDDQQYEISAQSHGDHRLLVYFTCTIDGEETKSNELFYDLICYKEENYTPIISSDFNSLTQEQYIAFNMPYRVYTYNTLKTNVKLLVDDEEVSVLSVDNTAHTWNYKWDGTGEAGETWPQTKKLSIIANASHDGKSYETRRDFTITFVESQVKVTPVTTGLKFQLSSYGKSNDTAARSQWIDSIGKVACKLTDFNWSSNGWLKDDDGNTVLRVAGDARVEIPYQIFNTEPVETGKTIEIEFATHNIHKYTSKILQCLNVAEAVGSSVSLSGEDDRTKKFIINTFDQDTFKAKIGQGNLATYVFTVSTAGSGETALADAKFTLYVDSVEQGIVDIADYGITLSLKDLDPSVVEPYLQVGDRVIITYTEAGRGLYLTSQLASLQAQQASLSTQYKEDDHVRLTFVIEKAIRGTRLIWMYINGIASGVTQYPADDKFKQVDPQNITIGSSDATIDLYTIRIYDNDLSRKQVVNNWVADTRDGVLKATRYYNNDNYDETGKIVIDKLPSNLPYMVFSNLQDNKLPEYKGDKRTGDINFTYPLDTSRNFHTEGAQFNVQGTSSQYYFKKNFKTKNNNTVYIGEDEQEGYGDKHRKYPLTPDAIPARTFTLKADVASSEGANNVEMVRYFEDTKNWWTPSELYVDPISGEDHKDSIRVGIDGFPMVAFFNDGTSTDFYAKMNFNNDKSTEDVYGFSSVLNTDGSVDFDHTDESWEFLMNNSDLVLFKSDDLTNWAVNFESRFPETIGDDEHNYGTRTGELDRLQTLVSWVVSTNTDGLPTDAEVVQGIKTATPLAAPATWGEYKTHEEIVYRTDEDGNYILDTDGNKIPVRVLIDETDESKGYKNKTVTVQDTEPTTYKYDTKDYRLAKFRNELEDHFNLQSCLFFYLFTELFLLVDNRAKNATLAYYYSRTEGDGGDRWFWIPYDMDTALGINNEGLLVFDYNAEDTDLVNGAYVYNGQRSTFWINMREAFPDELHDLYVDLRAGNAGGKVSWKYDDSTNSGIDGIEDRFEEHQAFWSETIFNEDSYEKCIVPLENDNDATYLGMLQGSKLEQRRWWLSNRFKYIDSKYRTGDAKGTSIMLRAYQRPDDGEGFNIVPYSSCYVTAIYDQEVNYVQVRAEKDKTYTIDPPSDWNPHGTDAVVALYSADLIKDIGDISGYYVGYADFSSATKLEKLKIGDSSSSYQNEKLTTLNIGNNEMLKSLDVRNCSNLTQPIDVSKCINLEEIYLEGTAITGITLPDGGALKTLHLPGTLTALTIKNQNSLSDFNLADTSYLTELWLENLPKDIIYPYNYVMNMPEGASLQMIGIEETFDKLEGVGETEKTVQKFYEKLKTLKPIDSTYTRVQITGKVYVNETITYANYKKYHDMFPDLELIATKMVCNVQFYTEILVNGQYIKESISNQNIAVDYAGYDEETDTDKFTYHDAKDPLELGIEFEKTPTQQYYYVFDKWDKAFTEVKTDLSVNAVFIQKVQTYTITFDTASPEITVEPISVTDYYGSLITAPTITKIPENVELENWYKPNGDPWYFSTTTIYETTTLTAKWKDEGKPSVVSSRSTFNSFDFEAKDNLGIVGYALVKSDRTSEDRPEPADDDWQPVTPAEIDYTGNLTIDDYGRWTMWVKDSALPTNFATTTMIAYKLDRENTTGIESIVLHEGESVVGDFALSNTVLTATAELEKYYTNFALSVNGEPITTSTDITVNKDLAFKATCEPRTYKVLFNLCGKGSKDVATQYIVYQHKVTKPADQYSSGYYIEGWYLDNKFKTKWDFDEDSLTSDIIDEYSADNASLTLYANWLEYSEPSLLYITIPEDATTNIIHDEDGNNVEVDGKMVLLQYYQRDSETVGVDFGDGNIIKTVGAGVIVKLYHTYESTGDKIIKVYGNNSTYQFGNGYTNPIIMPAKYLVHADFAWDVAQVASYAFQGATNLDSLCLTSFMNSISIGQYANTPFESIELPTTVTYIGDQAFMGCHNLKTFVMSDSVTSSGNSLFMECEHLEHVTLSNNLPVIGAQYFFDCYNLQELVIPSSVTAIDYSAFANCSAIRELDIPASVTRLGTPQGASDPWGYVFNHCTNLETLIIRGKPMSIGRFNFEYASKLTSAGPLPADGVYDGKYDVEYAWDTEIPDYAFEAYNEGRGSINKLVLPDTIQTIGDSAFRCQSITTLDMSDLHDLTTIGDSAFAKTPLISVTIPYNAVNLGKQIFYQCQSLQHIALYNILSTNKVQDESSSWFAGIIVGSSYPTRSITIPHFDSAADVIAAYGAKWNYGSAASAEESPIITYEMRD